MRFQGAAPVATGVRSKAKENLKQRRNATYLKGCRKLDESAARRKIPWEGSTVRSARKAEPRLYQGFLAEVVQGKEEADEEMG